MANSKLSSEPSKLDNPEMYENFLKVAVGLTCVRDGLSPLCTSVMKPFHSELLKKNQGCKNDRCNVNTKSLQKLVGGEKMLNETKCSECYRMIKDLVDCHEQPEKIFWSNVKIRKLISSWWEPAKVYMAIGQRSENDGPLKTDLAGILQLLSNCTKFKERENQALVIGNNIQKLRDARNDTMHSCNLIFKDSEMKRYFDVMIDFLTKSLCDKWKEDQRVKKAVDQLKELKSWKLTEFMSRYNRNLHEEEVRILKEVLENHGIRLKNIEDNQTDKAEEVSKIMLLVAELRKDSTLNSKLGEEMKNVIQQCQESIEEVRKELRTTVNKVDKLQRNVDELVTDGEELREDQKELRDYHEELREDQNELHEKVEKLHKQLADVMTNLVRQSKANENNYAVTNINCYGSVSKSQIGDGNTMNNIILPKRDHQKKKSIKKTPPEYVVETRPSSSDHS